MRFFLFMARGVLSFHNTHAYTFIFFSSPFVVHSLRRFPIVRRLNLRESAGSVLLLLVIFDS